MVLAKFSELKHIAELVKPILKATLPDWQLSPLSVLHALLGTETLTSNMQPLRRSLPSLFTLIALFALFALIALTALFALTGLRICWSLRTLCTHRTHRSLCTCWSLCTHWSLRIRWSLRIHCYFQVSLRSLLCISCLSAAQYRMHCIPVQFNDHNIVFLLL